MPSIHNQVVSFSRNKETGASFHLTGGLFKTLNEIRANCGLTRSEIIRRSIAMFFIAKREQLKGNRIAVIDSEGNVVSEIYDF